MEVFILYRTDEWFTYNSQEVLGVFSSSEKASQAAEDDAALGLLFDNDSDIMEFSNNLDCWGQAKLKDTGYRIEKVEMD